MKKNSTRENQEIIFRELYYKYKDTPMAVSSESINHKKIRYNQIAEVFRNDDNFSVHDIGMGLGDFYSYLRQTKKNRKIIYSGSDILSEYVDDTRKRFPECKFYHRDLAEKPGEDFYDYLIMSGVFHQRRNSIISEWEKFAQNLLKNAFQMCKKGIAFNFITPFVDFYQTDVYYCNLSKLLNFVVDNLSRFFVLNHNYALFEFTVFVYKEEYLKTQYREPEIQKYFKK